MSAVSTQSASAAPSTSGWKLPDDLRSAIVTGAMLLFGLVLSSWRSEFPFGAAGRGLIWTGLAIGLVYGGRAAWEALRQRNFDIDVLMVVAAVLAAKLGHPEDGGLLLFLFNLSGALEDRAMRRAMRAVEALHALMPTEALVLRGGSWVACDPGTLVPGERIKIRPGELIPTDAEVAIGETSIDQATLTGESLPREVAPKDDLYAGTLNLDNPIEATVTRAAAESSLQKILNLVISAQQQREPVQRAIDRLSQPYATSVMAVCSAVFLIWWLALGEPAPHAAYTAIALLIVASPCALVIATPTATLAAISRGARAGLLFKGGQAIDRLARLSALGLDKTGTLTLGRARLQQVHAIAWSEGSVLLGVAAGLESGSTHPIATAIVEAAKARGVEARPVADPTDIPGRGLAGFVEGREARLGTFPHCEELIPVCLRARAREVLEKVRSRGQIGVIVVWRSGIGGGAAETMPAGEDAQVALLILSDSIRPGAPEMISELHRLGVRPIRMLTGDSRTTAAHIASQVGVDTWDAELLPQDKVRILEDMKRERVKGGGVGVIGDGANDAPALAAADVSIAIGSIGSDAALESSDIVLLHDNLTAIPWGVRLSRRTRGIIRFNIGLALSVISGMGAATLVGSRVGWDVPLYIAVLAHEGGTLVVVLNSLRLLLAKAPGPASAGSTLKIPQDAGDQISRGAST